MRILITRPREDSRALSDILRRLGHETITSPVMQVDYMAGPNLDLAGVQAFLATSANGVRAIAKHSPVRSLPVYAVGDATARAAGELGFTEVISAGGDVESLAALVTTKLTPADGALFHAAGETLAGDLGGALTQAGFDYRRETLYVARALDCLSEDAQAALSGDGIDGVLIYSPRSAKTFMAQVKVSGVAARLSSVTAYCLSKAVADALDGDVFRAIKIADHPDQEALLRLLD